MVTRTTLRYFTTSRTSNPVIYGPRLAMSMLQGKMEEAGVTDRTTIQTVGPRDG